jgi:hypothetical protein
VTPALQQPSGSCAFIVQHGLIGRVCVLQAIPILNDALAALDTIKEADITYIKKLTNPPSAIKTVLQAVCVVLDIKPAKVRGRPKQATGSSKAVQMHPRLVRFAGETR